VTRLLAANKLQKLKQTAVSIIVKNDKDISVIVPAHYKFLKCYALYKSTFYLLT